MLSMVSFGFCLRTVPLDNYVIIVNFAALDLLGDLRGTTIVVFVI